jgi:hypothetical protein
MRNEWFPTNKAEYMTALRFRELGLTRKDVGERDTTFGTVDATELEFEKAGPEAPTPMATALTTSVILPTPLSLLILLCAMLMTNNNSPKRPAPFWLLSFPRPLSSTANRSRHRPLLRQHAPSLRSSPPRMLQIPHATGIPH